MRATSQNGQPPPYPNIITTISFAGSLTWFFLPSVLAQYQWG